MIATEDKKFWTHWGIRPESILRAFVYGAFTKRRVAGTSTLTQQLVKNAILTNERTITRKLKEFILAIRLEQKYSKEQILQIYFNEIPYGSTNYGVEAAAQSYFGKSVGELNLEQLATLAGLPKAPTKYLRDHAALKARRDFVLERMVEEKYLTRERADDAQKTEPSLQKRVGDIPAPHFVFYVIDQLNELYGEKGVETGGYKVITSLDWDKQQLAEKAVKEEGDKRFAEANADNAALVAIDPKTGQILAYVGSRDIKNETDGWYDVASKGRRQPGSSFKPIIYAAAFEKGFTPDTLLFDVLTNFAVSGEGYKPHNYDDKEHGIVTMREGLQRSLNIPAVETMYLVGLEQGLKFAERLGYTTFTNKSDFGLSLVLGGGGVSLIEHTSAYGVFANNGIRQAPVSILKIEDSSGDVLQEWKSRRGEAVLDEKITATISNVLSDDAARAPTFGSGGVLTLPDRPVATKTGTTNGYKDAWTVGYTPSLVTGVWVGRSDNKEMRKGDGGSKLAAPIWNNFMRAALKGTLVESFPDAPQNDATKPILRGSIGGGITLSIDRVTGKIATSSTPSEYIEERIYVPAHSILHYVNKDDPRGPAPENPLADPQYMIWEEAIQEWVERKRTAEPNWNITFGDPPTEYDDAHSFELMPSLTVLSPAPSSTLTSRQLTTDIRASAPRGVKKVTYKIDGRVIAAAIDAPFNLNYYARELPDGEHRLTVVVADDIGNQREETVVFTLSAGEEPPYVSWVSRPTELARSSFPQVLLLSPFKPNGIQSVRAFVTKPNGEKQEIGAVLDLSNLFNNQIAITWQSAEPGDYMLSSEMVLKDGSVRNGESLGVRVE